MTAASAPQNTPAQLAKAALRRLATHRQEPTPENYRLAYEAECRTVGMAVDTPPAVVETGPQWSALIQRITRAMERSHRQWTTARKRESLERVLEGSKQSAERLLHRLQQLSQSWEQDKPDTPASDFGGLDEEAETEPSGLGEPAVDKVSLSLDQESAKPANAPVSEPGLPADLALQLADTLALALPANEPPAQEAQQALSDALAQALQRLPDGETSAIQAAMTQACDQTRRVIEHRHHLVGQLVDLCTSLTDSLVDLAEDDSWVSGQCVAMKAELSQGLSARGTRRMQDLLEDTRLRQKVLKQEREAARLALKEMIHQMLSEIAELGHATGRFQDKLVGYADTIGQADTLEGLAGVVREMVAESRAVHGAIANTQERLQSEHARATELTEKVRTLEDEIRKLSDEVSTDPLTQIANRRGLSRAFEAERSRVERQGALLSIGLLDVDNFKKLNDTLGHQTGDEALKFLARRVSESLRPSDVVARYGGEEFVVLLPDTPVDEAQQVLTRLQRQLSAEFFTQDDTKVFITFSAGVTQYRTEESIEAGLDRADLALYEAKRTGKNRTCMG
ncbi:MAG TPA: GGDEF domain-containing protein [Aquabacterium sp.]|nr:GGDEF domain-containing protein [Aquabacterium sp.]